MSLNKKIGVISCPSSTGNQTISSLGFTPELVLFWADGNTAAGASATPLPCFGAFDDSGNEAVCSVYAANASGSANTKRSLHDDSCIKLIGGSGTIAKASYVSVASGEFTINWTTVSSGRRIYYCALGGLTNVEVGVFTSATSTGNQDVTTLGFEPDALIMGSIRNGIKNSTRDDLSLALGFFDGTNQQGFACWDDDGLGTIDSKQYYDQSNILSCLYQGAMDHQGAASFLSNGFRMAWDSVSGIAIYCMYIAVKGIDAYVGNTTQRTTTGTTSATGVGFTPEFLMCLNGQASTGLTDDAAPMVGLGISTSAADQGVIVGYSEDGVGTSDTSRYNNEGYVYAIIDGTPSLVASADIDSLDSDGFTLNFDTTDAVARYIPFLALAISAEVKTPVMVPSSSTVISGTTVAISCATSGASIYYTIDGSTPDSSDTLYTVPITITADVTIKAIGISADLVTSAIASENYTIVLPKTETPEILPLDTFLNVNDLISLSCNTVGASIYYTLDGSTPTELALLYTTPIIFSTTVTITAFAIKDGYDESDVISETYTLFGYTDWKQHKNLGAWDFTEQPNKWGYLNNPRWTETPKAPVNYDGNADEEPQVWSLDGNYTGEVDRHLPCGHWHKQLLETKDYISAAIFGNFVKFLHTDIDFIAGVYYDDRTRKLTYIGNYKDTADVSLQALDDYDDHIIAIEGTGSNAQILQISVTPINGSFPVIGRKNVLDQYDITDATGATIIHSDDRYFITSQNGVITSFDYNLANLKRAHYGTCAYSPADGALYVSSYVPILGGGWSAPNGGSNTYWKYIENQTTDSEITPWGSTTKAEISAIRSIDTTILYYKGEVYLAQLQSPYCEVKRLDPDTLHITQFSREAGAIGSTLAIYEPYIYSSYRGISNGKLKQGLFTTLKEISEQYFITGSNDIGSEYLIVNNWLVVTRSSAIDIYNPTTAAFVSTYAVRHSHCILIEDNIFAAAGSNFISVFEVSDAGIISLIDSISVNEDGCSGSGCTGMAVKVY